jgi:hypothetical protein
MDSATSISMLRAASAGAAAFVIQPTVARRLGPRLSRGLLGVLAVVALACYFNLGRPQFWDAKLERPSYVHNFDMRVYFPIAKYFRELRYDGVYLASVAALVDNRHDVSIESLGDVELRDLHTHEIRRVRDVAVEIEAVRRRFTPQRWAEFREDMRYFQETMGRDYLSTMVDHGGNATPVWLLFAHALFGRAPASNATFLWSALLDPLLLLALAIVVARAFGARTALVCLIVYGATDFYMFGSNWSGSTLRNDWMVALGLGVAALRRRHHALGGALLSLSALLRAFPAMALVGLTAPPLYALVLERRRTGAWPSPRSFLAAHAGTVRALVAAIVTGVVLIALSAVVLSPASWGEWAIKASLLGSGYHVNSLGLRTLTAGDFGPGEHALRWALYLVGAAMFTVLTLRAARARPNYQAALIFMLLCAVYFYPANYYFHFVFLLPLLATSDGEHPRDTALFAVVLLMCVAELPATFVSEWPVHFGIESAVLLVGAFAILVLFGASPTRSPFHEPRPVSLQRSDDP